MAPQGELVGGRRAPNLQVYTKRTLCIQKAHCLSTLKKGDGAAVDITIIIAEYPVARSIVSITYYTGSFQKYLPASVSSLLVR